VLYGVTMGEPGVSRLVSVKVNENAIARSDTHGPTGVRSTLVPEPDTEENTQVA
jgi:hypothetical protein